LATATPSLSVSATSNHLVLLCAPLGRCQSWIG
jgi:hypothetical protein